MRKLILLLLPVFTYAQSYNSALYLHNTMRDYYNLQPLVVSEELNIIAQEKAFNFANKDKIKHDNSDYGESVYYTDEILISEDYYSKATIAWTIDSDIESLQQILCDCKNIGLALSYKNNKVYVVAIYDKIY